MNHLVRSALARAQNSSGKKDVSNKGFFQKPVSKPKSTGRAKETKSSKSDKSKKGKGLHSDNDLIQMLEESQARIMVVGCGGGGCNTIERMAEVGIKGAVTFAVNTDAQDLLSTRADKKLLIGKKLTRGLGAGSDPQIGESAARESIEELQEALRGMDLVFVTCGMGGGTGTGSAPVVAEVAKRQKSLTVAVVTLPFTVEGRKRIENAMMGLERLSENSDTIIVIPNDKILEIAPDLPINAAFKVADEVLTNAVKGITEMVTKPGLINLDFSDLKTILSRGGAAMIGLGESSRTESAESRALEAVENALTSPLLDVDISNANRALVNVCGGTDMTLREAEMIVETVSTKIHSSSHIIWGAMVDEDMPKNNIQAMVVIAGGKFPYLERGGKKGNEEIDLGIEFT
ncbi:MAG: cell division protein FtsZ [Candidatus Diapherotrites archaeon]|uniref:Cell division protein FtsZ n=1 Tax=Candidatus Iainarchaeum sp. TaxID=3101447 RepID=A0A7K4BYK6_9ARCH|nr:cell division protein FtsZ [Candidatus Diapherotrites archaeon]